MKNLSFCFIHFDIVISWCFVDVLLALIWIYIVTSVWSPIRTELFKITYFLYLLVGAGMRCCKFKTTWISSHRAPGPFGGLTKANLGSLLCIRLHGFPQEGFVDLEGCEESANLCHLVLQHGGAEIPWRVCRVYVYLCVWTICHAWVRWQRMRLCYIMTSNDLFVLGTAPGRIFSKKQKPIKPSFFPYIPQQKVMEALGIHIH